MAESLFDRLAVGQTAPIVTEPVTLVIFGGVGDLAHRKLLPALYNLHLDGLLPPRFAAVGVGRKDLSDDSYRDFAKDGVTSSHAGRSTRAWQTFAESVLREDRSRGRRDVCPLGARLTSSSMSAGSPATVSTTSPSSSLFVPTVKLLARRIRVLLRQRRAPEPVPPPTAHRRFATHRRSPSAATA
jgi:glucose-6-phosphate 1-dehydrogenase